VFGAAINLGVFEDYVVVITPNFPKESERRHRGDQEDHRQADPLRARHASPWDHSYGNAVSAGRGERCRPGELRAGAAHRWPKEFKEAGRRPAGRKDVAASTLKVPNVVFDDKLFSRRKEPRWNSSPGHAHTSGDAFAYLPKHKFLCTAMPA